MTIITPPEILSILVGFTIDPGTTDLLFLDDSTRGLLDTGTLAGTESSVDVTADLMSVNTRRGSSRVDGPLVRYEAGSGSLKLRNTSGDYDPTNLSGPYVSGGVTQVQPMRPITITATYNSISYPILKVFADAWTPSYAGVAGDLGWAEVDVPFTDAFQVIENVDRVAVAPVGAGEDTGARINRILDSVSWSTEDRDIATGDSTLQATDLSGSALAEAQTAADSELGEFYVTGEGKFRLRNRNAVLTDARSSTSQHTFGDDETDPLQLPFAYPGPSAAYDREILINRVQASIEGGTVQTAEDLTSQQRYLIRTGANRTDLMLQTDADALNWASFVLMISKDAEYWFPEMTVLPLSDPDTLFPVVLGAEIGDRFTIIRRVPGGNTITRDVFVRGIEHDITVSNWITKFTFQSATKYAFMVLDIGALDEDALGF